MHRVIRAFALCAVLAGATQAQFQSQLATTYAFNNGQSGNQFDIVAINDVTICGFDVNLDAGTWDLEVYIVTGGGSKVGVENTAAAWTLVGTALGVVSAGGGAPTLLPIAVDTPIAAGATQGFYVTVSNGTSINYTNGTTPGAVFAQDANIQFLEGSGHSYPFGSLFNPRVWNGTIYYEPGMGPGCVLPRPPTEFALNEPGATLTISGAAEAGPFGPTAVQAIVNTPETLDLSSTSVGLPWEVAVTMPGAAGGLSVFGGTFGGQAINVNLQTPGLFYLNGGAAPNLSTSSFPGAPLNLPFSVAAPMTSAAQMAALDPGVASGVAVSHAVEYTSAVCGLQQNFDNLALGAGQAPAGWVNPSGGASPWNVDASGTPSTGTGPTAAFSGANYMYCETSVLAMTLFEMDTCAFDTTGLVGSLNFQLSRIGATVGTLNIFQDDGAGFGAAPIATYTGPDPAQMQGGTEWSAESIPVTIAGPTVAFRFSYTSGTSFTGDLAIDDLDVQ